MKDVFQGSSLATTSFDYISLANGPLEILAFVQVIRFRRFFPPSISAVSRNPTTIGVLVLDTAETALSAGSLEPQ